MMRHHQLRCRSIRACRLPLAALFCCALLSGAVAKSLAQDGGGTESVFRLGPTARGVSLGNAMVGMANDASAPYWNAALLPHAPEAQFAFSYNSLYSTADGASYQYLGMVYPTLRAGGFGIGFLRMAMGDVQTYDASSRPTGNVEYAETQLMFSYGYGGRLPYLGGRMDLGLTAKIHSLELVERASSGGMDLALAYAPRFTRGLRFSYVFQNLVAPSFRLVEAEDTMPTAQRFAMHKLLRIGHGGVLELGVAYDSPQYASGRAGFGAEYRMQGIFVGRVGLEGSTVNFGLGGRWRAYSVDYAFRSGGELGASQFLSFSWFFGESLDGQRMRLAQERQQELEQARLEAVEEWRRDEAQAAVVQLRSALAANDAQSAQQQLVRARALGADQEVLAPLEAELQAEQERRAREAVVIQVREIQVLEAEKRLRVALDDGNVEEARSALSALRELVADHPMLSRFQQEYDQLWAGAVARASSQAAQAEEQGDWVTALQAWERVAQLDPRNTGPVDAQARWRAELDAARNDSELARREADRARGQLEEEQRYAVALERFAQAEWEAAEVLVMELLALSPDHAGALELQALLEARRQAPRALDPQEEEKVRGYYLAGLAHFSDGDYEAAIQQWQRILGIDAQNEGALNNIAEAQARLSRLRGAGATGSSGGESGDR